MIWRITMRILAAILTPPYLVLLLVLPLADRWGQRRKTT